jgi:hypothetical protein
MREEAAANEALLIDFAATEAGKFGGGGGAEGPVVWGQQGPQGAGAVGWIPPQAGFAGYPPGAPFPSADRYGPMDQAANSPPPPYGYPYPQAQSFPGAGPVEEEKKQPPPSFNIPPNNLGANEKPTSNEKSPTGPSKPLNTSNLQVLSILV